MSQKNPLYIKNIYLPQENASLDCILIENFHYDFNRKFLLWYSKQEYLTQLTKQKFKIQRSVVSWLNSANLQAYEASLVWIIKLGFNFLFNAGWYGNS